jgi:predicted nucleotidyltransferase
MQCMSFSLWCFDYAIGRKPYENQVLDRLQTVLQHCLPGSSIQVFGSFATGLSVPGSDVDVVICGAFGGTCLVVVQKGFRTSEQFG